MLKDLMYYTNIFCELHLVWPMRAVLAASQHPKIVPRQTIRSSWFSKHSFPLHDANDDWSRCPSFFSSSWSWEDNIGDRLSVLLTKQSVVGHHCPHPLPYLGFSHHITSSEHVIIFIILISKFSTSMWSNIIKRAVHEIINFPLNLIFQSNGGGRYL